MAANKDYAAQLGRAWAYHRQGNNDGAIQEFTAVLNSDGSNLDALYGLGLAQRASGKSSLAVETFGKLRGLVATSLQENPGTDRFEMLERMVNQRLAELEGNLTV
ncbi:MAG: tetratricopeptide repeat protein [Anaerolineae bacterium]